ncbi:trehalose-6-phosphate synthase [Palleronia sediminis]|uniref:Trehalose-6-phosphate synthase n=1 Tax=Palleronia sediminis TaxID=2547833 RepID=A0A4R6A3Z1_9RHOB|nr:trehalose-6-phosphate synthase [Palleronia sediminis]TDL78310.1 trehalose-6-phosphate synthase [Palleronia sediminis]
MSQDLIVVSNRLPAGDTPSGGLVVALDATLKREGGLWLGAAAEPEEYETDDLMSLPAEGYEKKAFRLNQQEYDRYYLGYANSVLWPLCHRRTDLLAIDRAFAETYVAVNRRIARHIAQAAGPDSLIWVQDYHFLPLAYELRKLGVQARIGFFLHIPFPSLSLLEALPEREIFHDWIAAFDLVGLQTRADVARCLELFRHHPRGEILLDGRVKHGDSVFSLRAFPIGIDTQGFADAAARSDGPSETRFGPGDTYLIGVDRLDYSKGLPNRFTAFGRYLDTREDKTKRPSFLQIAPPSRQEVPAYRETRLQLEAIAGRVNGENARLDWTPITYIHRAFRRADLPALYRMADVGLVTPLVDGMNLVAKEYVAAQDPDDPGVLILSRMAGAAEDMTEALLVNPFDIDEMAEAIATALNMPLAERRRRHAALLEVVRDSDVATWTERFMDCLRRA